MIGLIFRSSILLFYFKKRGRRPDNPNSKLKKIEAKNASKQKKNFNR